jgi:hypothetical protein
VANARRALGFLKRSFNAQTGKTLRRIFGICLTADAVITAKEEKQGSLFHGLGAGPRGDKPMRAQGPVATPNKFCPGTAWFNEQRFEA